MAAATTTDALANKKSILSACRARAIARSTRPTNPSFHGIFTFQNSVTVATTNIDDVGDELYFFQFPDGARLIDLQVHLTDVDTNGTPLLTVDFNTDDGTTEATLINDTTIGRAGGYDELDAAIDKLALDVGGKYLSMKVVAAAATAAAGTLTFAVTFTLDAITTW